MRAIMTDEEILEVFEKLGLSHPEERERVRALEALERIGRPDPWTREFSWYTTTILDNTKPSGVARWRVQ